MSELLDKKLGERKEIDDKLMDLLPDTHDLTLMVLKGHLIVEESLYSLVESHCSYPAYITKSRLSFAQLTNVSKALITLPLHDKVFPAIEKLNNLRNQLAHNITSNKAEQLADDLILICGIKDIGDKVKDNSKATYVKIAICYILGHLSVLISVSASLKTEQSNNNENA